MSTMPSCHYFFCQLACSVSGCVLTRVKTELSYVNILCTTTNMELVYITENAGGSHLSCMQSKAT